MPVDFDLYLITDSHQVKSGNLHDVVDKALMGGLKALQLREKDLCSRDLYQLALELRRLTSTFGALLLVNDRIDIALAVDADGVHLAENSIPADQARKLLPPEKLIGVSCHDLPGAVAAEKNGADFITFGPVFPTPSKAIYGEPVGLKKLAEASATLTIPVFGLGGVSEVNMFEVLAAGASGVALISAILASQQPQKATANILKTMREHSDDVCTDR